MGEHKIGVGLVKAVFLDRDGTLIKQVFNKKTKEWEPAREIKDLEFFPEVFESLKKLQKSGYELFLVSNQPDVAKGKTTMENLQMIHNEFDKRLTAKGIHFKEYYYCYHHPDGTNPEYSYVCECRKPKPFFLFKAKKEHDVDLAASWMIGDRDSDVECGQAAGTKTIRVDSAYKDDYVHKSKPDFRVKNMEEAVNIILGSEQ